ncbi:ATP-grasp domain-containing protein [Gracilibacillus alcaliphilus]|uniref:ATP-grasp domain-containing protein n=1 Tax=Gracilibacillus alcaliphilus TaxID=1401441 RepID=UPI00195CD560|nr:ATP-grasp domain-containing protein [Gracilibacillus alcaliphilus]MBM7676014.1 carbamoyl-phosphate synthase large subunit [Gracilibacillus alcaliphilus]
MNVLVTSISKKIPLLQAVKKAVLSIDSDSKLFGCDVNSNTIGRHFVDVFWQVPFLKDLSIDYLIQYCQQHDIRAIIPTRDGELSYFAAYKQRLEENNIHVMISSLDTITKMRDKWAFFHDLRERHLPVIETAVDIEDIQAAYYVVKDRYGSGSMNMGLRVDRDTAKEIAEELEHPIFQPYFQGKEFTIDMYVNKHQEVVGTVVRSRDYVVQGESQMSTVTEHPVLAEAAKRFSGKNGFYGHIVLQALENSEGEIAFIECNPRFGGASTLSIAAGLDSFYWFLQEVICGQEITALQFNPVKGELQLIRYPQDLILEKGGQ